MKKWIWTVLGIMVMAAVAEEREFRAFTAKDGRTIEARILEYDAKKGRLQIERRGAGKVWVAPDVFGEADQAYIKEWAAASTFLAKTSLRVSMDKQIEDRFGSKDELREGDRILYEISVKNNSRKALEGLRIEYRYFFKRVAEDDDRSEGARTISGTDVLPAIDPTRTIKFKTMPTDVVERYSKTVVSSTFNGVKTTDTTINNEWEDELLGIWLRIYGPEVGGTTLYCDFTEPDNLMEDVDWGEADSPYIEKIKARGWAIDGEYTAWLNKAVEEVKEAKDEARACEIVEAFEVYHEPENDFGKILAGALYYKGFDAASAICAEIVASQKNPYARIILVDLLSSSPDSSVCNGERAVEQALTLNEETPNDAVALDLLARAYARNGQFDLAEKTQKKAIEVLKGSATTLQNQRYQESFNARLALYANGQPYTRGEQDVRLWEVLVRINGVSQFPVRADRRSILKCIYIRQRFESN